MKNLVKLILGKLGLRPVALRIRSIILQLRSRCKWRALRSQSQVWLELGAGAKKGSNGWVTVDFYGADIAHDLRKGIPLPNESVDRIYTSHMFEHIPYKELVIFINECFRVLKKGGELSVCVPNAGLYIRSYIDGVMLRPAGGGYKPAVVDTGSMIDQVNYIAYMDGQHNYLFDKENLVKTLEKAPFSEVSLREFDESIDLKERDFESIYAKAIR